MSFERVPAGTGIGAEPGPTPGPPEVVASSGISPAMRLQILSTEHWSLLASRSLAWNESFSRAGMFLSALSAAIVTLALVSQASDFGDAFAWFALLILPVVLIIGIGTYVRGGRSNHHDAICVAGMNRIRAAYLELAPDLERYFVTSGHDDPRGIAISMGSEPGGSVRVMELLSATGMMIAILNAVVAAVIVALSGLQVGAETPVAVGIGVFGFVAAMALQVRYATISISRVVKRYHPLFPSLDDD